MAKKKNEVVISMDDFEAAEQIPGISEKDLEAIAAQTGTSPEETRSVLSSALGLLAGGGAQNNGNNAAGSILSALTGGTQNNANNASGSLLSALAGSRPWRKAAA